MPTRNLVTMAGLVYAAGIMATVQAQFVDAIGRSIAQLPHVLLN